MSGQKIEIVRQAMKIYLKSLPQGSYYQIIGFGTKFIRYNEIPIFYTKENIEKSIKEIENIKANLGVTCILEPLKYIYNIFNSIENKEIKYLNKNIFILTDGGIFKKEKVLKLIESNKVKFHVYPIGIGKYFDADLFKNINMASLEYDNYNYNCVFCENVDNLNRIISEEIIKAISNYNIYGLKIKTSLDDKCWLFHNEPNFILSQGEKIDNIYIVKSNNNFSENKISVEVCRDDKKNYLEKYEIKPIELPNGNELFKLASLENSIFEKLTEKQIIDLALKYQILSKYTLMAPYNVNNNKIPNDNIFYNKISIVKDSVFNKKSDVISVVDTNNNKEEIEEII